jgi:hypothetical protein
VGEAEEKNSPSLPANDGFAFSGSAVILRGMTSDLEGGA